MLEHLDWYQEKFKLSKGKKRRRRERRKEGRMKKRKKRKKARRQTAEKVVYLNSLGNLK